MRVLTRDASEVENHPIDRRFVCTVTHNWETMKTAINDYIGSLNWGYRVSLRDKNVNYVNAYAEFVDPHKIKVGPCKNKQQSLGDPCLPVASATHRQQTSEGRRHFTQQRGLSWRRARGRVTWASPETRSTASPGGNTGRPFPSSAATVDLRETSH